MRYDDGDEEELAPETLLELILRHADAQRSLTVRSKGTGGAKMEGERDPPVWVKIPGYPWWPCWLGEPSQKWHLDSKPQDDDEDYLLAVFYGGHNTVSWVTAQQIRPFEENRIHYAATNSKSSTEFRRALREADGHLKSYKLYHGEDQEETGKSETAAPSLSEYEKKRLQNIARNNGVGYPGPARYICLCFHA